MRVHRPSEGARAGEDGGLEGQVRGKAGEEGERKEKSIIIDVTLIISHFSCRYFYCLSRMKMIFFCA